MYKCTVGKELSVTASEYPQALRVKRAVSLQRRGSSLGVLPKMALLTHFHIVTEPEEWDQDVLRALSLGSGTRVLTALDVWVSCP